MAHSHFDAEARKGTQPDGEQNAGLRVIVHSFFVIPFFVALGCVFVIWLVRSLTADPRTARDLLMDVKTGGLNKRWQAAFELARLIHHDPDVIGRLGLQDDILRVFENSRSDDPRVRHYLALAMGRSRDPLFLPVLVKVLRGAEEETDRIVFLHALGLLNDPHAVEAIADFTDDPSARVRAMAAAALAAIDTDETDTLLKKMLNDDEPNVKWIATLALADVPSEKVVDNLLLMLDDRYWDDFPNVDDQEKFQLMRMAVEAAADIGDERIRKRLSELTQHDNIAIRRTAFELLNRKANTTP